MYKQFYNVDRKFRTTDRSSIFYPVVCNNLCENSQTSQDLMAFGIDHKEHGLVLTTPWFHCREFFNDIIVVAREGYSHDTEIRSLFVESNTEIYGLYMHPFVDYPLEEQMLFVDISYYDNKQQQEILNKIIDLGDDFGKYGIDLPFSLYAETNGVVVLRLSPQVIRNTYSISLFTREIRACVLSATEGDFDRERKEKCFSTEPEESSYYTGYYECLPEHKIFEFRDSEEAAAIYKKAIEMEHHNYWGKASRYRDVQYGVHGGGIVSIVSKKIRELYKVKK